MAISRRTLHSAASAEQSDQAFVGAPPDVASNSDPGDGRRSRITRWFSLLCVITLIALMVLHPSLRTLIADTWRELRTLNPAIALVVLALKAAQALLSALTWQNALNSAWPKSRLPFKFILGVDTGQDALNTFAPGRAGTWAMIGAFTVSIPGATVATMLAIWAVQSLSFMFFSLINYTIIAIGLPQRTQTGRSWNERLLEYSTHHPAQVSVAIVLLAALIACVVVFFRNRLIQTRDQLVAGMQILRTPAKFVRLIFLPSLASYTARAISCALLLSAFDIPVNLWTLALALGSRAAAGAVRLTPGGLGTTQAIEVVALADYASPETVIAYSLVDLALTTVVNFGIAIPALVTSQRWRDTRTALKTAAPISG